MTRVIEIKIRKAVIEDVASIFEALCKLENQILDFAVFERIFISNISNSNYLYYIAEHETIFCGFFILNNYYTIVVLLVKFKNFI